MNSILNSNPVKHLVHTRSENMQDMPPSLGYKFSKHAICCHFTKDSPFCLALMSFSDDYSLVPKESNVTLVPHITIIRPNTLSLKGAITLFWVNTKRKTVMTLFTSRAAAWSKGTISAAAAAWDVCLLQESISFFAY